MHFLVSGATGFVGDAVLRALDAAGHKVTAVVRPGAVLAERETLSWDIARESEPASRSSVRIDSIIHLAQARAYRNFPADAPGMFAVNVLGTQRMLDYAAELGVKRFCLVSSGAVYDPFEGRLSEDLHLNPAGYLGASKLAAETVAGPYASIFSLAILRLFQPYGLGQTERLLPDIIRRVKTGTAVSVGNDGNGNVVSPTFVDDVADVIMKSQEQSWSSTYNVAAPVKVSIRQIAEKIGEILKQSPRFEDTSSAPVNVVPDLDKLSRIYPLDRFRDLDAGLRLTLTSQSVDLN